MSVSVSVCIVLSVEFLGQGNKFEKENGAIPTALAMEICLLAFTHSVFYRCGHRYTAVDHREWMSGITQQQSTILKIVDSFHRWRLVEKL